MKNMKTCWLVGGVVLAHVLVFGLLQGCGTVQTVPGDAPERPAMPTRPPEPRPTTTVVSPPVQAPPVPRTPIQAVETTSYVVVKGDTLSRIARRFNVSMAEIMALSGVRDADTIHEGQKLLLPGKIDVTQVPRTPTAPSVPLGDDASVHVVRSGETLSHIAVQYGVTVAAIQRVNQLKDDRILAGQRLAIPDARAPRTPIETPTAPTAPKAVPAPIIKPRPQAEPLSVPDPRPMETDPIAETYQDYVVEVGDTLRSIAMNHAVSVSELRNLNRIPESEEVVPGQTLKIPRFE